jgi:hypothetical protein
MKGEHRWLPKKGGESRNGERYGKIREEGEKEMPLRRNRVFRHM